MVNHVAFSSTTVHNNHYGIVSLYPALKFMTGDGMN